MTKFLKNVDVTGYISQTSVTSSLIKADSNGKLVVATAGTDYQAPTTALLPSGGTAGQILSKIDGTNYNTTWIDNFASQLKHEVKLGATLSKGDAVYVSSANGTNMIVSAASNAAEATSSKTLGLLETGGVLNDFAKVVTEGLLAGLNTSTATAGDPVWLGTGGNLIFGLANKPSAPAHLVFIGIVTRVSATVGEIFVKVQNGFELEELHNVSIASVANNEGLFWESATSLWKNKTIAAVLGYTPANGANYLALTGGTLTGDLTLSGTNPRLYFTDTDNNPDYFISNTDGTFTVYDVTNSVGRFKIYTTGNAEFSNNLTAASFVKSGGTSAQILVADGSVLTAGTGISISAGTISSTVTSGVSSFNTRTGAVTLSSGDVTGALGFTPYNATNPSGYITSSSLSSYLPLTGGTMSGAIQLGNGIAIRDNGGDWILGKYNGDVSLGSSSVTNSINFNSATASTFAYRGNAILHAGNYSSYALPLSGGVMTGSLVNNTDGAVLMESNASENNNWLWKENAKTWGLFWFNRGSQSGQTIGSYSTIGAELMFMGGSSGIDMPTGWTGYASGSKIAAMISNYNGYIYSASTVYAAGDMRTPAFRFTNSSNNAYLTGNSDWGFRAVNDNGYIQFGPANGSWTHIYSDKSFYFNQALYVNGTQVVTNSGTWGISVTGNANNITQYTINQSVGTGNSPSFAEAIFGTTSGATNQGIQIRYQNYVSGYGRIRFYQSDSNHATIHVFSSSWQNGSLASSSTGAINLDSGTGITFGPWNNPDAYVVTGGQTYARGYRGIGNVAGTGEASYHPAGMYSVGTQWLYGTTYRNSSSTYGQGQIYFDTNYGYGMVGLYSSTRYQAIFAMGDAYKIPVDGTNMGNIYGLVWSHPNAGGQAGYLNDHGLIVGVAGLTYAAISSNIWARGNITANGYIYANASMRMGDMWEGGGLYRSSGNLVFGTEGAGYKFMVSGTQRAYIGTDGNMWMQWAGDYISNLLSAKATHRGEGSNYVDYSRYVYNNGAYSGSGWIEPSDLGVRYSYRSDLSYNSDRLYPFGASYNDTHPGYGLRAWYDWAYSGTYRNGITLGSHPSDQSYGWQIWQNMWDDRTYTRRYNGGWQSTRTLLTAQDDPYAYNMNQYVRSSDSPTFQAIYAENWFRAYGDCGLYTQSYGGHFRRNTSSSYGTWETFGYTKNGWGGINSSNNYNVTWMNNTSGDFGFLTENGNGWNLFYNNGNNCWGIGTDNTYSGDGFRCIKYGSAQYGWTTWSDRRAKENISTITGALDKVLAMRGVNFNYIIDEAKTTRVGFIAQELMEVLPEAVRYAEEIDEYNVEYGQIVSVLAEAIKEQNTEIQSLKAQLQTLLN